MNSRPLSRRLVLLGAGATSALVCASGPVVAKIRKPADPFIESLLKKMTIEEKAGQLSIYADPGRSDGKINPNSKQVQSKAAMLDEIAKGHVTGVFNGFGVAGALELQRAAVTKSRLGIPMIFAGDVLHGIKTIFPVPLAEACSFDPDLCTATARASALECNAMGIHWTFAPMVDIARDERWGRVVEGSGEDTYLSSILAAARVRGFQGSDLRAETSVLACPKHFAAYGAVEGGMEYNSANIPETTLRQVHLPPFKAAFDAGALSTMSSFNTIGGIPSTGNHYLLTTILRDEWHFRGLVVSDYTSEQELVTHGYAEDDADAVVKALTAGCDMSMQSGLYFKYIPQLVQSGRLSVTVVDEAVRRVLRVKKALGLFENPYRSMKPEREATDIRLPQTIALARESARKSIVLLKNDDGLLPLPKTGKIFALIGPFASDKANLAGPWTPLPAGAQSVSIEEGLRTALGPSAQILVSAGSGVNTALPNGVDDAVRAAMKADIVIMCLGEDTAMSGEAAARTSITIPAVQMDLATAVAKVGKPMVILMKHGRALALEGAVKDASAIVCTWFLGSETGNAVADIIFGVFSPQGRLAVSFPNVSGQEPYYYNHLRTGRPEQPHDRAFKARYLDAPFHALYPFGYGLTYSSVEYGATKVESPMSWSAKSKVTASLSNTGKRAITEVAQLYVSDLAASIVQPVRVLKGFQHVTLQPGETKTIEFELERSDLAFVQADLHTEAEPGQFDVWIAPSSDDGTSARLMLTH